jgi:hypothetical protein
MILGVNGDNFLKQRYPVNCTMRSFMCCTVPKISFSRWAGHVARMEEERKVYKVLVGNPEGKRPLGRPRRRCEDGIRIDLKEIGGGRVEWIQLAQ